MALVTLDIIVILFFASSQLRVLTLLSWLGVIWGVWVGLGCQLRSFREVSETQDGEPSLRGYQRTLGSFSEIIYLFHSLYHLPLFVSFVFLFCRWIETLSSSIVHFDHNLCSIKKILIL